MANYLVISNADSRVSRMSRRKTGFGKKKRLRKGSMMSTTSKTSYKSKSPTRRFFRTTTLKNTAKKPLFNSKRPSPIAVPTLKRSTTLSNIGDAFGGGSRTALMKGKTQELDLSDMGDDDSPLNKSNNVQKKSPSP